MFINKHTILEPLIWRAISSHVLTWTNWLNDWLIDWLIDWLGLRLNNCFSIYQCICFCLPKQNGKPYFVLFGLTSQNMQNTPFTCAWNILSKEKIRLEERSWSMQIRFGLKKKKKKTYYFTVLIALQIKVVHIFEDL